MYNPYQRMVFLLTIKTKLTCQQPLAFMADLRTLGAIPARHLAWVSSWSLITRSIANTILLVCSSSLRNGTPRNGSSWYCSSSRDAASECRAAWSSPRLSSELPTTSQHAEYQLYRPCDSTRNIRSCETNDSRNDEPTRS